uniref:Secreted protein n=1 Tax=Caenorhabditis tropicalis TaxID=1561998 RepID=A0A1I7TBJ5_9PELO
MKLLILFALVAISISLIVAAPTESSTVLSSTWTPSPNEIGNERKDLICKRKLLLFVLSVCGYDCKDHGKEIVEKGCHSGRKVSEDEVKSMCCPDEQY